MSISNCSFSTDFARSPNKDAVDGLAAIAMALDNGLEAVPHPRGHRLLDMIAIAAGWIVLVAVVLHPELQLAAIGIGVGLIAVRSMFRYLFAPMQPAYAGRGPDYRTALQLG